MLGWLSGHEVEAVIALGTLLALGVSIHAEWRMSRITSMSFPGVIATRATTHKAGPRHGGLPPLQYNMTEIRLDLTERAEGFAIADVQLTRLATYLGRYDLIVATTEGNQTAAFVARRVERDPFPRVLMVKLERRGVQASCWQKARIEDQS